VRQFSLYIQLFIEFRVVLPIRVRTRGSNTEAEKFHTKPLRETQTGPNPTVAANCMLAADRIETVNQELAFRSEKRQEGDFHRRFESLASGKLPANFQRRFSLSLLCYNEISLESSK